MCGACCKEVKGWWKSFTVTECFLIFLEVILLVLLFVCLVFVVLHLVFCGKKEDMTVITHTTVTEPSSDATGGKSTALQSSKCTWKPSQTTVARTRYYEGGVASTEHATPGSAGGDDPAHTTPPSKWDVLKLVEAVQGDARAARHAAALVRGETALCALVRLAAHWALGAAACVAAAGEEADGGRGLRVVSAAGAAALLGVRHHHAGVALLRLHPRKSDEAGGDADADADADADTEEYVQLADSLDMLTLPLGQHLTLLKYDTQKPVQDKDSVVVEVVAASTQARCGTTQAAAGAAARGARLCAACYTWRGAGRGAAGGGVLLRARVLLGVAASAACPHTSYVAVAPLAGWVRETIANDSYE